MKMKTNTTCSVGEGKIPTNGTLDHIAKLKELKENGDLFPIRISFGSGFNGEYSFYIFEGSPLGQELLDLLLSKS